MATFEIVKCHGSGNDFIMVDTTREVSSADVDWSAFARVACSREEGIGSDGVLLVVKNDEGLYGMDMLNPDGTHAEMCGNGMRCVARMAAERGYMGGGMLFSAGKYFSVAHVASIAEGIESFAVNIPIATYSRSFPFIAECERFVGRRIEALHPELEFTALSLGNPHIVARVDSIDMELLRVLGERVIELKDIFPEGVNLSLYRVLSSRSIFVATYERGAGITLSCGTAMTASATAASLLGYVDRDECLEVVNRGGMVHCTPMIAPEGIVTRLEGNATFEWWGEAMFEQGKFRYTKLRDTGEQDVWLNFVRELNKE